MRSHWKDMDPVDDFVTQQTPGLKIWQKVWGDMQCAYHIFAPGTDFTALLAPMPDGLCGVPHHAYVISGTLRVIYKDGSEDVCTAGRRVLLAGSAQLHLGGRGRDHPVQREWRAGCAGRGRRGDHGQQQAQG